MISVNSHALANEVSDDKRFIKSFTPALYEVRNLVGDGLFTVMGFYNLLELPVTDYIWQALGNESNWGVARMLRTFFPSWLC